MNTISITQLRVWPGNPRKTVSEESLEELARSIRDLGIQQPVVVRALTTPIEEVTHEVVDGQRRYLAAQRAELHELPVVVRDIDDTLALEIALAANTARVEPEPLEEAEALEALVKSGRSPIKIAERLGRSVQWIERRRKLLGLCEEARAFARMKSLSFAHMLALAVVDAAVQHDVIAQFAETSLFPPAWQFARQISFRLRKIDDAPFDPADATLGGEGSCAKCVYRSDTQGDLFGDTADHAACLRGECWNTKTEANWERAKADAKKRKLAVFGDHKEVFAYGEVTRDESRYTVEVPEGSSLVPVAVARTASGKPVPLYDAAAAEAAWAALKPKRPQREEDDSAEGTPPKTKVSPQQAHAEDRARRRAASKERLLRLAKVLEDVDGLERLALAMTQESAFEVAPEVYQASGGGALLGKGGIEAHRAPAVFILSCVWDKIREEEYSDGKEIDQWIASVLGEEPTQDLGALLVSKLSTEIEQSKSARNLGDAWQCIASIDREVDNVNEEQIAVLTTAWRTKAESIGLSEATLKKMAAEGKGPAIKKKKEKRAKKSKTAEATP